MPVTCDIRPITCHTHVTWQNLRHQVPPLYNTSRGWFQWGVLLKYTSPYLVFVIYCLFYPSSNILLLHNYINITVTDFSNMSQLSIQVET